MIMSFCISATKLFLGHKLIIIIITTEPRFPSSITLGAPSRHYFGFTESSHTNLLDLLQQNSDINPHLLSICPISIIHPVSFRTYFDMLRSIHFRQLNMHRAFLAAVELKKAVLERPSVCFLTEPYQTYNKIAEIPPYHVSLPQTTQVDRPRAALLIPKDIPHVYIEHLSGQDISVALLNTEQGKLLIASVYLDSNDKSVVPPWLTQLAEYIDSKSIPAIVGFDSNAHSDLYGPDTNARGVKFEDFILQHNFNVENIGHHPTYHAFRYDAVIGTCIDVTLSKGLPPIRDWRVEEDFNGSDHYTITWEVPLQLGEPRMLRPWKSADWQLFKETCQKEHFDPPTTITTRKIDRLVDRFYTIINKALDVACPLRPARPKPRDMLWFGKDQKRLRNRTKRKYDAYKRQPTPARRKAFVATKRIYHKTCRRGKRSSWRSFIEKTPDEASMAFLTKLAQRRENKNINALLKQDGTTSEEGIETIQVLTQTHFPAATSGSTPFVHNNTHKFDTDRVASAFTDWINPRLVKRAVRKFKPYKAAGPDALKPVVLHHLPDNLIDMLTLIYQACIALRYTPDTWRETKVIFLPKPGKQNYNIAKDYRPISLSNFPLKTLERLATWKMDSDLIDAPLHPQQHGFTTGKSTESAVSRTVDYIEQHVLANTHCLAVFLDISSAFDSISIDHIKNALLKHNGDPDMVEWYHSYLQRRLIDIELHGERVQMTTSVGFPQGGVCSAKFWLVAFDEAIQIINSNNIVGTGYADDCSALIGGGHSDNMIETMQAMLDRLVAWGHTCNLRFNPLKTVAIIFTRTKKKFTRPIRMDGQLIPLSHSVVYLGITLDSRLNWAPHIKHKIQKAKALLMKLANLIHSYWGPKPKLLRWAYTGMVRPIVTYGAMIWGHESDTPQLTSLLRKLNRQAMNIIVKVPRSTPTNAMEIILGVPPLHLYAIRTGAASFLRQKDLLPITWEGVNRNLTHSVSHLKYWHTLALDLNIDTHTMQVDTCDVPTPQKQFTVDTDSFHDHQRGLTLSDYNVYTDGSKIRQRTGAGVYIVYNDTPIHSHSYRLPNDASVFQAEILAIQQAALTLQHMGNVPHVKFFVDSQAALLALNADNIMSKSTLQTIHEVNKINALSILFVWTKAHIGTAGNERADELAKAGTEEPLIMDVPTPSHCIKHTLDTHLQKAWAIEWKQLPKARQAKIFLPTPGKQLSDLVIQWPRLKLGRYIRAVTGHNNLLYHLSNIDATIPSSCRFCWEEREEFQHLAYHCPALWWDQHVVNALNPETQDCWTPDQVIAFCYIKKINDAFTKPLFAINENTDPDELRSRNTPDDDNDSQESAMDADTVTSTSDDSDSPSSTDSEHNPRG